MNMDISTNDDQEFSVLVGGNMYVIRFYVFRGIVYADIQLNGDRILTGGRVYANRWIVPFGVSSSTANFRFETTEPDRSEYPTPADFNGKFVFSYYTGSEIEELEETE